MKIMKTLNNYIIENELAENILNRLYFHTCVEFKLDHNLYPYIVESLGKFDNAGLVVKHIIDELQDNFESQKINCQDDNVYFKYIDIQINNQQNGIATYIKYQDNTVFIELFCKSLNDFKFNIDRYIKTLIHELLHGYEDYNRIKNTGQGIFAYYNDKYKNSFNNINSQDDLKMWLSRCNYFLNSQERNAYLSQLESDIDSLFKNEHITIKDFNYTKFKNKLKETDIWKEYFKLSVFILKLKNSKWNNEQKQYVEFVWDNLYSEKKTFSQIIKELYNNWEKFEKKFEQLVPKIICKYIETNLKEVAFDISLLDKENYWENLV